MKRDPMTKRGRVLRATIDGPGLLMLEGRQYEFSAPIAWKSDVPPRPGSVVDVVFGRSGEIQAITPVSQSQIERERALVETGREASSWEPKIEVPTLAAAMLLALGWWLLPGILVFVPILGRVDFTFWEALGFLNAPNVAELLQRRNIPSPGIYGALAVIAFAGPWIRIVWQDKTAALGAFFPLIFMGTAGLPIRNALTHALQVMAPAGNSSAANQTLNAISLGLGSYVAAIACLYFAFAGSRKLLGSRKLKGRDHDAAPPKAA